jgi:hypothetical protein
LDKADDQDAAHGGDRVLDVPLWSYGRAISGANQRELKAP